MIRMDAIDIGHARMAVGGFGEARPGAYAESAGGLCSEKGKARAFFRGSRRQLR
jgi:hypothetical protein